jgi:uncharacterized membrane protein
MAVLRLAVAVFALSAAFQWSRKRTESVASTQPLYLVLDASPSFDRTDVSERLAWLKAKLPLKVCLFGSHAEFLGDRTVASELLGSHRTSRFSTLVECAHQWKEQGVHPESLVVLTDSELKWDAPLSSLPVQWVHLPNPTEDTDLAVRPSQPEQPFFEGSENHVHVEVFTRGISGDVPLGIYSPLGLIKTVTVPGGKQWERMEVTLTQQDTAKLTRGMPLLFSFPKLQQEKNHQNNEAVLFPLWAPHKIRILHVSGSPSTDTYYVRRWLKSQPNFEVISFYILKDTSDDNSVPQDELSLIPFPVDKLFGTELDRFQVVILQNFEWSYFLNGELIRRLKSYLQSGGHGVLMMGGPRAFKPIDMNNPDLQALLPFRGKSPSWEEPTSYKSLDGKGRWSWADQFPLKKSLPALSRIAEMPRVDGANDLDLREGALPWAGVMDKGRMRWLVASQHLTEGRVVMMATDQLFRWYVDAADLHLGDLYGEFLERLMEWLSFNDRLGRQAWITPSVAFKDEMFHTTAKSFDLFCGTSRLRVSESEFRPQPGSAPASFCRAQPPNEDAYEQWIYVSNSTEESQLTAPSLEELKKQMATMGASLHVNPSALEWDALVRRTNVFRADQATFLEPMWSKPWFVCTLLGLLILEWCLRRRSGLR